MKNMYSMPRSTQPTPVYSNLASDYMGTFFRKTKKQKAKLSAITTAGWVYKEEGAEALLIGPS